MSENDKPRAAFERLRKNITPAIKRPGVEAVRQTVQRRRTRTAVLSCILVLLAAASIVAVLENRDWPHPVTEPTPWPSVTETPVPTSSASPSTSTTPLKPTLPTGKGATKPSCIDKAYPWPSRSGNSVSVRWQAYNTSNRGRQLCGDDRVLVQWWIYNTNAQWKATIVKSGSFYLSNGQQTRTIKVDVTVECGWILAVRDPFAPGYSSSSPPPAELVGGLVSHTANQPVRAYNVLYVGTGVDQTKCPQ